MNLAQYHFDNDLLARDNDSLKLDSDESAPDWIAVECFTKLKNQELPQEEIGSEDFLGVKGGGGRGLLLQSNCVLRYHLDLYQVIEEEQSDNELCSENDPVNDLILSMMIKNASPSS